MPKLLSIVATTAEYILIKTSSHEHSEPRIRASWCESVAVDGNLGMHICASAFFTDGKPIFLSAVPLIYESGLLRKVVL